MAVEACTGTESPPLKGRLSCRWSRGGRRRRNAASVREGGEAGWVAIGFKGGRWSTNKWWRRLQRILPPCSFASAQCILSLFPCFYLVLSWRSGDNRVAKVFSPKMPTPMVLPIRLDAAAHEKETRLTRHGRETTRQQGKKGRGRRGEQDYSPA